MIKHTLLALLSASLLVTPACAEEKKPETAAAQTTDNLPATTAADWRGIDPENTLYIKTEYGTFVVEMAPEFAPKHVAQLKKLTRQKFYDNITFHRVIKGFMNQTGDPRGDGAGDSNEPDIEAEFTFKRSADMKMAMVGEQKFKTGKAAVGFYKGYPIASQDISMAMLTKDGKVNAWGIHCPNITSMARGTDTNSANSQFFLMRGEAKQLDQEYSIWGTTVWGREGLKAIKVGTVGEDKGFIPDRLLSIRVAADIPADERINVQVMRTDTSAFRAYLDGLKSEAGDYPKICDIEVPTRLKP